MTDVTLANAVFPSSVTVPPHGLLYLTSSLEEAGRTVTLRDYQLHASEEPWDPTAFAAFAEGDSPVLGISCMSYALPLVIVATRILKERAPDRRIVLGGIGPSPVAQRLLAFAPHLDAVVIGEGEQTMVELTQRYLEGGEPGQVPGIVYRDAEQVRTTTTRPRRPTLEEIPWPAYSRVTFSDYRIANMQYGRGCPFRCSFCDIAPYWGRKHTHRSVASFVDELELLVRHGVDDVFFVDDTFVLSNRLVDEICDEILRRRIEVKWGCYARTDLVSPRLLAKMAAAGCQKVFYGVESGSDTVLDSIRKGTTRAQTEAAVAATLDHMPFVTTSFVWGFPEETLPDLEETVCLLLYFAAMGACPQLNLVLPYSYSQLFHTHRRELRFLPEFSSQLCFYQGDNSWAQDVIRQDVELFSAFYRLPTHELEEKWSFLDSSGLNPHELQSAFFKQPGLLTSGAQTPAGR